MQNLTVQVYQVFIKATLSRSGTRSRSRNSLSATSTACAPTSTCARAATTGRRWATRISSRRREVLEADPPRRLSHTWTSLYDPEMAVEEPSRVTWEIEARDDGTALLTVTHDQLEGAPKTAAGVYGTGWMGVLSSLKTLLETGEPL